MPGIDSYSLDNYALDGAYSWLLTAGELIVLDAPGYRTVIFANPTKIVEVNIAQVGTYK